MDATYETDVKGALRQSAVRAGNRGGILVDEEGINVSMEAGRYFEVQWKSRTSNICLAPRSIYILPWHTVQKGDRPTYAQA